MALGMRENANGTISFLDYGNDDLDDGFMDNMAFKQRRKRRSKHKKSSKHTRRFHRKKVSRRANKTTRRSGRIKYTKRGQPYIIQSNGRAKFIKRRA